MEEITNIINSVKAKNKHFINLLYTSIIRHGFDNTGLTKSKIMFSNVLVNNNNLVKWFLRCFISVVILVHSLLLLVADIYLGYVN